MHDRSCVLSREYHALDKIGVYYVMVHAETNVLGFADSRTMAEREERIARENTRDKITLVT